MHPKRVLVAALFLVALGITACSTGASSSKGESNVGETTTTSTAAPVDYRSALIARLSKEWNDPVLASAIITPIDQATLDGWEAKVPMEQVATSPLLTYDVPASDKKPTSIVAYAFGYVTDADGSLQPGPVNEAIAASLAAYVKTNPTPIYTQPELGIALAKLGVANVMVIQHEIGPDGKEIYQSTASFTDQLLKQMAVEGMSLGTTAIVGFADHEGRCVITATKAGIDGIRVAAIELPSTYDPQSVQPWTRDRKTYLTTDLAARFL